METGQAAPASLVLPILVGQSKFRMTPKLSLSTFQIGSPAKRGQGLRIGVTRRPPHGVPKQHWALDGYFDLWCPSLAPGLKLLARYKNKVSDNPSVQEKFFDSYERQLLGHAEGRQTVELIARMAERTPVSIGCYCRDELNCHRSRLYELILRHAPRS